VDLSLRPEEISLREYVAMSNVLGEISFSNKSPSYDVNAD
jgi:hypothetical protein